MKAASQAERGSELRGTGTLYKYWWRLLVVQ